MLLEIISNPFFPLRNIKTLHNDLRVTVDFNDLRFLLVRGSPYVTLEVSRPICLSFATESTIRSLSCCKNSFLKHKLELNNNHILVIYTSSEIELSKLDNTHFSSGSFAGVIRFAIVPDKRPENEEVLDLFSTCYPVSGEAKFGNPFCLDYKWEKKRWGDLLMLAHPLHLKLFSIYGSGIKVLEGFRFKSIDGDLVGIVGDLWKLRVDPIPITWHSIRGIPDTCYPEIVCALWKDVGGLDSDPISTTHCLHYALKIARGARLGLIAEEVSCPDVIPAIKKFLKATIEPWLLGKFEGNGFLYDKKWGGIISKQGASDASADYGFGLFTNHHYYLGYYVFCIAFLAKLDPDWGLKFRLQAYALVASYMSMGGSKDSKYTRLRSFDFYKLHSWVGCLGESIDGLNSENPSESMNAYYSATLLGMAYGDDHLTMIGSTLASFEIVWENKREDKLWFAAAGRRECIVGIQVVPLIPITEILLCDLGFVREIVDWAGPSMGKKEASDEWKGGMYALEAMYDKKSGLKKIRNLKCFNEGNSFSNQLWWVHSRKGKNKLCTSCRNGVILGKRCWFCDYCC